MNILSPKQLAMVPKLRKLGIQVPVRMLMACKRTGMDIALGASLLMQESGGGRMEWGHDGDTIFAGGYDARNNKWWGESVTQASYAEYKRQRGPEGAGGMQGVGDGQLTWWSLQDRADALGGCYKHLPNIIASFEHLQAEVVHSGLHAGVALYNGSGPAAAAYAQEVIERATKFRAVLGY